MSRYEQSQVSIIAIDPAIMFLFASTGQTKANL